MDVDHFQLNPAETALVIVDVQEKLAATMPEMVAAGVIQKTLIFIEAARLFDMPILVTEQYPRGLGPTVAEVRSALGNSPVIEKITFSCWQTPAFQAAFKATSAQNVLLCGMESHVCILQTALDLRAEGKGVFLAADTVCSRAKTNWQLSLDIMRQADVVIGSCEIFIFQMLSRAGTPQFKALSKLLK